jgi:two-component system cell cycle sensor histidine kinase/response regulator CckA
VGRPFLSESAADPVDRRVSDRRLPDFEEPFRRAFEDAPIGMALIATEAGRIARFRRVNPALSRIFGRSPEELLVTHVAYLFGPDGRREIDGALARILHAGEPSAELEYERTDDAGLPQWLKVSLSVLRDDVSGQPTALVQVQDVSERRHAQNVSALRYRTLVSQLPDALVVEYDNEFRVVAAEGPLLARSGWDREAILGQSLWDLLAPVEAERFAVHYRAALAGRAHSFEWTSRTGAFWDVDIVPLPEPDGSIGGAMILARDISERKRVEQGLHFQAQLLDRLDVGVVATDAETRVTHWNRQAERYFKRSREEVLGRTMAEVNADFDLPDPRDTVARLAAGHTHTEIIELTTADATGVPILVTSNAVRDEEGRVVGYIGVNVDITEARRAAAELHSAHELFENAFEGAPLGMALVRAGEGERGVIERANRALGPIFGRDAADLLGRRFADDVHPEDLPAFGPALDRLLSGQDSTLHAEIRLRQAPDETVWCDVSVSLIRDTNGVPLHAVVLLDDKTAAHRATAEKSALEARLHRAQRLDGIGRLAGGIAHDFNNLLAVILTYAVMVSDRLGADDPLRADVEEITNAANRAAALTRQLLVFGRSELVQPRPVDVNGVLANTERLLARTIGEHVELATKPAPELWNISGDPSRLEQVILNLALNGRDSMPAGGRLTIETCNVAVEAGEPDGVRPGRYVALTVRDEGTGMDPDVAERAFEPFFSTKPAGSGSGLGLATVYGIVTQAGGSIDIDSAPGRGTTVRILVPACFEEAAEAPAPRVAGAIRGHGECVLVVEDDEAVRTLVTRVLTEGGYSVLVASHPEEALKLASGHDIDLVVTDVVMPGMSGAGLVGELGRTRPALRAMLMSGYTNDIVTRHGAIEGQLRLLAKPFTPVQLLESVRATLDGEVRPAG